MIQERIRNEISGNTEAVQHTVKGEIDKIKQLIIDRVENKNEDTP